MNVQQRGYACIGLDRPKSIENIGSALRAAGNFNASMVAVSGRRYRRARTDTGAQYRHCPLLHVDDLAEALPYGCVPVAVDLIEGARPLTHFTHPEQAFYIFGAEDATLGSQILRWCQEVIYVPTRHCMNLAGTVHVVLYDRLLKQSRQDSYHAFSGER